jgi:hypothetical protein
MNTTFKQSREAEPTSELIEAYVRRGHELRAEAIAHGVRRWLTILKRQHTRSAGGGNAPSAAARA